MENRLLEEALKMPPNERVELAELILASIDYEHREVRDAWIAEVQDRIVAVREGRAILLDFESLQEGWITMIERITANPKIVGGKPITRGTRTQASIGNAHYAR